MKTVIVSTVFAAILLTSVESGRIKILLGGKHNGPRKYNLTSKYNVSRTSRPINCDQLQEFDGDLGDLQSIKDTKNDDAQFYQIDELSVKMGALLNKDVPGTDKKPSDFFDKIIEELQCGIYIYGGAVRDILRGKEIDDIKDVDAETDCNLLEVHRSCVNNFEVDRYSESICSLKTGYNFALVTFGDHDEHRQEVIDLGSTEHTFSDNKNFLEYTPNAVAYHYSAPKLFFGLANGAVVDACKEKIGIPVEDDARDDWAVSENTQKNGKKIFRFYKLILKKFTAKPGVEAYVQQKATVYINRVDQLRGNGWPAMRSYFCNINYNVPMYDSFDDRGLGCLVSREVCEASDLAKAGELRKILKDKLNWEVPTCGDPQWQLGVYQPPQ